MSSFQTIFLAMGEEVRVQVQASHLQKKAKAGAKSPSGPSSPGSPGSVGSPKTGPTERSGGREDGVGTLYADVTGEEALSHRNQHGVVEYSGMVAMIKERTDIPERAPF